MTASDLSPALRSVERVPPAREYLRDAWAYRDFMVSLALADARSHHVDTALGNLWQLLNPALLIGIYYLIFGVIFDVTRGLDNFIGFLAIGVFMFTFTRRSMASGARAILNNRPLMQSIRFPRIVLPLATVLAEFFTFLPTVAVIFLVAIATGESVGPSWLIVFPLILVQLIFNAGLAMGASRLTARFRDLEELLPFALRLWFYTSGVLYPVDRVGEALGQTWQRVFEANPAHVYIAICRDALLDERISAYQWSLALGWAGITGLVAFVFFKGHELEYGNG